ncbi:MAG: JAB domain-containing protein, partial [Candidatus Tectomicrobia bacterium]|nr:JAB domain-containing protein [Candidatus Tectomicrobia bacterium]
MATSPYNQPIKEWPEDERPRERLLQFGEETLSEAQLLGIILRTG